jgi:hypothetical protein
VSTCPGRIRADQGFLQKGDHRSHAEQGDAIARYLRWRNARAQPERDFAAGSAIRTWTSYQNKVA